jgi:hypothetical protein
LRKHEEIETINNSLTESEKDIEQYLRDTGGLLIDRIVLRASNFVLPQESLENAVSALMLQSSNLDIDLDARTKSYDEAIIIRDDKNAEYSRLTESLANLKSESEEVAASIKNLLLFITHASYVRFSNKYDTRKKPYS